jgi:hypothetical protein
MSASETYGYLVDYMSVLNAILIKITGLNILVFTKKSSSDEDIIKNQERTWMNEHILTKITEI